MDKTLLYLFNKNKKTEKGNKDNPFLKNIVYLLIFTFFLFAITGCSKKVLNDNIEPTSKISSTYDVNNKDNLIGKPTDQLLNTSNEDSVINKDNFSTKEVLASNKEDKKDDKSKENILKVHFLDVGQADAVIVESNNKFLVYDGGDVGTSKYVVDYLKKLGVKEIDYVIGSHPHADHIGGLPNIIKTFKIGKVILPPVTHTTKVFERLVTEIANKNLKITKSKVGTKYKLGETEIIIIAPNADYKKNLNNWSVGIKITNGNNTFLMYGDAEKEAEKDILDNDVDISADVLKIAHHGSNTSNANEIIKAIAPTYAVISVGEGNKYNHPHKETLSFLKEQKIECFRTDKLGTIIATSNGEKITFNVKSESTSKADAKNTDKKETTSSKDKVADSSIVTDDAKKIEVHITKTGKKYHLSGCSSLSKSDIIVTLEEAQKKNLGPCSKCKPPQ